MAKKEAKPKPNKQNAAKAPSKSKGGKNEAPLPYILDFAYSLTNMVVFLLGIATTAVSFFTGASILMAVLRGCLAMIGLGAVCWLLNYFLSNQVIETAAKDFQKASSHEEEHHSTMEVQA
ncbi:MAG: hypothetical protein ACOY16_05190 [Chloroflexota bacterium]